MTVAPSGVEQPWSVAPRCGFGICLRPAEHQVLLEHGDGTLEPVLEACGLHVTPAVVWGRPEPLDVAIRHL